jgi:hypothetical protein
VNVELPDAAVLHLRVALRAHIRQLRRDGCPVPGELNDLLARLSPQDRHAPAGGRGAPVTARQRGAARQRRYMARQRGQIVPFVKPGPKPTVTQLDDYRVHG